MQWSRDSAERMHEGTLYYHNFLTFKYLHCEKLPSLELEVIFHVI